MNNVGFIDLLNTYKVSKIQGKEINVKEITTDIATVNDNLTLKYIDPNKNIVSNSNKKLITEDKDSFVNTANIQFDYF